MFGTILSALSGGLLRMAPELLKFFDRKAERAHELSLQSAQLELIKVQGSTHLAEINAEATGAQQTAALEALRDAIKAQGTPTGIKWVDALAASVRPVWTYYVLLIYGAVKVTNVWVAIAQALPWEQVRPILWTSDDSNMIAALSTFWFLDRALRRQ